MAAEIRAYQTSDLDRIREMHAKQNFAYPFPDLDDPTFAIGQVAEDGKVQQAWFGKIHAELYLFLDPDYADPLTRWQTILRMHEGMRRAALGLGLDSVSCWIPPELPKAFKRRLQRLGWSKDRWESFSFRLR